MLKIDLGGGSHCLKGFINVDNTEPCDVNLDLAKVGDGVESFPWKTGTVDAVYSSHCFEHLTNIHKLWWEIARVLKTGFNAEIRVPHWNNSQANMMGHVRTLSEHDIIQMYEFTEPHWGNSEFWLELHRIQYVKGLNFLEAQNLFPHLTPLQICRFIPDTCHELRLHFTSKVTDFSKCGHIIKNVLKEVL